MRDPYVYNDFTGNNPKTQESILKKKKKKKSLLFTINRV